MIKITNANALGARPGRGARLLHREARDGAPRRRDAARDGQLPLAHRRAGRPARRRHRPDGHARARPCSTPRRRSRSRTLMAKGAAGGLFFATDDCQATYEELKARGVEFVEEPTSSPYGIDAGVPRPVRQLGSHDPRPSPPGQSASPLPPEVAPARDDPGHRLTRLVSRRGRRSIPATSTDPDRPIPPDSDAGARSGLPGKPVATLTPRVPDPRPRRLDVLAGVRERFDASTDFTSASRRSTSSSTPRRSRSTNRFEDLMAAADPPFS